MRFHPVQTDTKSLERLSSIFRESMERHKVLPVNPWKAKRLERWLAGMGARFRPESHNYRLLYRVETSDYVNFKVQCPSPKPSGRGRRPRLIPKINGRNEVRWVRIEIPWELADRILALGYMS